MLNGKMRIKIYNFLVNRIDGINYRYHKLHDHSYGFGKLVSYLYLIWLNFCYYCLFCSFLKYRPDAVESEKIKLVCNKSESRLYKEKYPNLSVETFIDQLKGYDVISFDVFDTLVFRPFSNPSDVFYLIGEQLGIMNFRAIRIWAEWDARVKCNEKNGHMEITLRDIWKNLEEELGCDAQRGMQVEMETESALCYANPFMIQVWQRLRKLGKRLIIISDMYLPALFISQMIENAGFAGAEKVYVSCENKTNKASGSLFRIVRKELDENSSLRMIHVGDHPRSDDAMARKAGWDTFPYQKNNINNRSADMSYIVGSAYCGLVCNHLYNGLADYSMQYEYGYIYGGLFVIGYCHFIHEYCHKHGIDCVFFLSRDGDILKQIYDRMYPQDHTEYVYWSRKAAVKLMADYDKHDYVRRFIDHKVNQKYTVNEILESMELDSLIPQLNDWKTSCLGQSSEEKQLGKSNLLDLRPGDELTEKNSYMLRGFIKANWNQIIIGYEEQQKAAQQYYQNKLKDSTHAAAVDIGWAGSGAMALSYLVKNVWKIPCEITGIIAGTNTPFNSEPDASEAFLQSGKLVAYLYSHSHNRDLLKKHDPGKDYNVFWELLLSSPTPKFEGFYSVADDNVKNSAHQDIKELNNKSAASKKNQQWMQEPETGVWLKFGKYDKNLSGIRDVQQGIRDFAGQYLDHFRKYPYMYNISGRDAYAPMLLASSHHEKYLKAIEKKFDLEINVD